MSECHVEAEGVDITNCLSSFFSLFRKKELSATKKDRVNHCLTICENIVAQSLR